MDFRIIRGKIPIYSIDATYMLDKTTGYIKLSRFAATTIDEFEEAVKKLQAQGMKDLILDLQTNGGGYMGAAIGIADHLLDGRKMIVYTDGVNSGRREEYSTPIGLLQGGRVVVLIDGNSASASEIVSGAVQDWDRGVLVGRRSFGKGLVQRQFPLTDGSMVRLTIAHYYTPSGRCIQKPYSKGEEDYEAELYNRYRSGEMVSADSIVVNDSLKYFTKVKQRPVSGGAREGCPVYDGGRQVGVVTSGTHCPFLGGAYAMAIVEKEPAPLGAQVEVEIRGKRVTAEVIKSQFYKR